MRCTYTMPHGWRCAHPVTEGSSNLCYQHSGKAKSKKTELERKAEAYDRLEVAISDPELTGDEIMTVRRIRAILEGK